MQRLTKVEKRKEGGREGGREGGGREAGDVSLGGFVSEVELSLQLSYPDLQKLPPQTLPSPS